MQSYRPQVFFVLMTILSKAAVNVKLFELLL